ncbi:MAG: HNH endonuclease [Planctomycetota bacterium]|nr:HNH endonuclease [Planctomycetota bacterium]
MIASDRQGLHSQVLLLNRFYMAMQIISARQSFILLYRDVAEVIDTESGSFYNYSFESWQELSLMRFEDHHPTNWIRSPRQPIEVPRIVRLVDFNHVPQSTIRFNRSNLYARDNQQCQYCSKHLPFNQISLDHVIPRSQGGGTSWENIVCSCTRCNTRKGGRTPKQARMKLLKPPQKPDGFQALAVTTASPDFEVWSPFLQK